MSKYVIIDAEAILIKRIEELEKEIGFYNKVGALSINPNKVKAETELSLLKQILSQSTPLVPELQKTWNAAYIDAMSIDEETYKPLFFEDFISNLKLDI